MKKITAKIAQEITELFEFVDEIQPKLDDQRPPVAYFQLLVDKGHYQDAITFLAHAIPPKEAVWWACVCARHHFDAADESFQQGLKAAEAWVYDDSEENRRICEKFAEAGDYSTISSWACAAAFWSGGSISAEDDAPIEVLPYIYAHAVTGSIVSSASFSPPEPEDDKERFMQYFKHGLNIADGGNG